jgi:hypothetical protein
MPRLDENHPYRLPAEFGYLNDVIEKYTEDTGTEIGRAFELAGELGPEQLTELAAAYRQILSRDHMHALSALAEQHRKAFDKVWREWCAICESHQERGLPTPLELEPQHRPRAKMLFWVFEGLARKRVPPFNLREVQYSPPPVMLDWSKLPEELRYVREPAMKYGKLWHPDHRARFARRMTRAEHKELKALAKRVRSTGDIERICEWERQYSALDHPEAQLTMVLLAVLGDIVPW